MQATERYRFCAENGPFDVATCGYVVDRLSVGPGAVRDESGGGARVVSVLIDGPSSEVKAAELLILGAAGEGDAVASLVLGQVDAVLAVVRTGPKDCLDVVLRDQTRAAAAGLEERGFGVAYTELRMVREGARVEGAPLTSGWRFVDLDAGRGLEAYDLVVRAFRGVPGFMKTPIDDFVERALELPIRPRVLLDGDGRVVGYVRVRAAGTDGEGVVELVARDPERRGGRLGDVLLVEAARLLSGASRLALTVVASNEAAVRLYRRHGFREASRELAYRVALQSD